MMPTDWVDVALIVTFMACAIAAGIFFGLE
jgi:hypothetical protein